MGTTYADTEHTDAGQLVRLRVEGMDCGSCVAKVEAAASRLPGVRDVSANLMAETLTAQLAPDGADMAALAGLMPRTARVERDGAAVLEMPAAGLAVGEIVQVRPGRHAPCNGVVMEGQSTADESTVTGATVLVTLNALRLLRWRLAAGTVS